MVNLPPTCTTVTRALARNKGFVAGVWLMLETQQEPTLDRLCLEVEQCGGKVLSIEEGGKAVTSPDGSMRFMRTFVIEAVIPSGFTHTFEE